MRAFHVQTVPPSAMMDAFYSSALMAKSVSVLAHSISKFRCHSRSNTCMSVISLVGSAEVSIEMAEAEDSSMEVALAGIFCGQSLRPRMMILP